ncbi:MAG: M23 family metallopeptidase [Cytophagaceae bacterium]|nr:M23 family metallopeptidase [Cytophagaceae bacterium]
MTTSHKKKSWLKKLNNKYRLVVFNEHTYEEALVLRLSRMNVFTAIGVSSVLLIILVIFLIAFTDLREFIPGYPDSNQRLLIVRNAQGVDSLIMEIERRNKLINNFQAILRGEVPEQADISENDTTPHQPAQPVTFERSAQDSIFRSQIEKEEKFNLSIRQPTQAASFNLANVFFFSPVKGLVINPFGASQEHYGVDIVASPGTRVAAVMDGVVTFSGWTVETGYVIQIQHSNNLISIYKHNERLLKDVGEVIKAGEAIARIGNSGELTTGPHLHFELWHSGTPLNPQEYMTF